MKLRALKKVLFKNSIRGCMEALTIGQEFELNVKEDAEQIFMLISNFAAVPIDPEFIPERAKYLCLAQFSYESGGVIKQVKPQEIISLSRDEACRQLVSGHIRPSDSNAWIPKRLLEPIFQPDEKVRCMFDLPEEKPANWATKGARK